MSEKTKKRGRPAKNTTQTKPVFDNIQLTKMDDVNLNPSLFTPMRSGTTVDEIMSDANGLFPGTNNVFVGDPGVGKSTVLLDILAGFQRKGKKVLFISGEMNEIDLFSYIERYPKFGQLPILFLQNYLGNVEQVIESVLDDGSFDCVLIDSWAEVGEAYAEENNCSKRKAESWLMDVMDRNNKGFNKEKVHTAFMVIQQMSKGGDFVGSNRIKHMTTSMGHIKFDGRGRDAERYIVFSKNRRGEVGQRIYYDLSQGGDVAYNYPWVIE
jgi:DNA repair protein RadA/Sms